MKKLDLEARNNLIGIEKLGLHTRLDRYASNTFWALFNMNNNNNNNNNKVYFLLSKVTFMNEKSERGKQYYGMNIGITHRDN